MFRRKWDAYKHKMHHERRQDGDVLEDLIILMEYGGEIYTAEGENVVERR